MRKSAGNESSLVTGIRVLRRKPPDFAPAFTEAAFRRTKKSQPEGWPKSSLSEGPNEPERKAILSTARFPIRLKREGILALFDETPDAA